MHAEIHQLIALRDGEPVNAAVAIHVRECDRCARTIEELMRAKAVLRELPSLSPPPDVWRRIMARRKLETRDPAPRRFAVAGVSVAAALAGVLFVAGVLFHETPDGGIPTDSEAAPSVSELQARSRELEFLLERYGPAGVMSLHTAGAISELEDSIALIDYELNVATDVARARELWRHRVELMETLVTVRAAESYVDSI